MLLLSIIGLISLVRAPTIPYENDSVVGLSVSYIGAGDGQSRIGDCKTKADDILDLILDGLETDPMVKARGYMNCQ